MWHAHMGGGTYASDTVASFDCVFDHNDNVGEAELGRAFEYTKVLFEGRFPGGPYNPPPTQVRPLSPGGRSWARARDLPIVASPRNIFPGGP